MTHEIVVSGFGGQGVMAIGKSIAELGMLEDFYVSWLPSYGAEVRGGSANCSVVLSGEPVVSPLVDISTELIAMNNPALLRFLPKLEVNGTLLVNSSIVTAPIDRKDVTVYRIPCGEIAEELGNSKVGNMVMLGAYVEATGFLSLNTVDSILQEMFTGRKAKLIEINRQAVQKGADVVKAQRQNREGA